MQAITTIGLDIAKSAFQVHGVDAEGNVLLRRQLKRRYVLAFFQKLPPCLVGIEACSSLHFWSARASGYQVCVTRSDLWVYPGGIMLYFSSAKNADGQMHSAECSKMHIF